MILTLITNLAFAGVAMIISVMAEISLVMMGLAKSVLALVTGPYFINLPYTSDGIVGIGWQITRDFANLGFALALLWIGLATALKLTEYEAKKTLPRLILMILLVNFSPVICGVVVDAANIVMNFFLGAIGDWTSIWNFAKTIVVNLVNINITKYFSEPVSLEAIASALAIIVFCQMAGFFFLLYSAIFIVRYVAIWVLVILSPLAFFAYVFGKTGGYFKQWWHQFFQWAIIGIPASFFLYLSYQLLALAMSNSIMMPPAPDAWGDFIGLSDVLNQIMVFAPVLILLFFGFLMTLSSGAMGASAIINTGKKWGKSAVNLAGKTTKSNIGRATRDVLMSEKAGKLTDSMVKSERKGLGGWAERGIGLQLGKARLGAAAQVSAFMNDKTLQGFIAQDNIDAAVAYAKRYDPLNPNNDIKQIAAAAAIGDQKKDIGLVTARKADPMFTRNAIDKASNAGLREFVKKIVGDAPSEADDDTVVKSYLYNDDLIKKEETNLGSILQEFLAIAKMSDDELKKPERKAEQRLIERLEERLGSDWRNKLRKAGNIKNIIGMRDSEVADTTKGVFGAVTGEWSLRKVVKGLDLDGTAKLSSESYKDAWIQNLYARMKNVSHFDKLNEVLAPDDYTGIKEGVGRIGSERLMDQNWTLAQSMVSGVKEYLFDGLTYQRDWTEPLRNKNGGLVKDKKTGNLIMIQHKTGERIENLQALRSYRGFISSGGGTTMTPGPGPAPTPGGPAPTLRRTPRPGGSTTSPLPAGTIPFGSNIPGSQGENVAARETDRIQKDIERRDKEARRADKERAEQKTATAAAEAMAASSPYKVGERVTVQGGKTGIVDRIPASGFVEVKYDDGTKSAWPIRNVSGTTKNPNSPPPAPAAGGGGTTLSSIPQGAPPVWFINNLPSVPLQDLGKGPQIGYAGGKILKHEGGAGENLEAHPIPGGMTYRTMIPPGMAGTPKKIEVDSGGKWMPLNNGQPAIFDKKSLVRIDGTEYRVSKDYTLIKSQPKT